MDGVVSKATVDATAATAAAIELLVAGTMAAENRNKPWSGRDFAGLRLIILLRSSMLTESDTHKY